MLKIREAIIVEGRYDRNTLSQLVDAPILETGGFSIFRDKAMLNYFRKLAEKRGLIILTDSDGAGFQIRNYLKGAIPAEQMKHAYIPDIPGKEGRKAKAGKEGKLGVEGMKPDVLRDALLKAGASLEGESPDMPARVPITKLDLYQLGLVGGKDSASRRSQLKKALDLPEHLSTNALLEALNLLFDRKEFLGE